MSIACALTTAVNVFLTWTIKIPTMILLTFALNAYEMETFVQLPKNEQGKRGTKDLEYDLFES